ncbi:MAG TPA: hypothetical protein VLT88_03355, partial [Desulfosarcina sp.]|nr:hypothetical protein [Desulfosarcina sp.]
QDGNNDGRVDLKVYYRDAERRRMIQDRDHDGRFETTQWFDRPPWSMVMEVDANLDGIPEQVYCYQAGVLREKLVDENGDGRFDLKEIYDERGRIMRSEEDPDESGRFRLAWFYDDTETAIRSEKDQDGDGRPDIWYTEGNQVVDTPEWMLKTGLILRWGISRWCPCCATWTTATATPPTRKPSTTIRSPI